MPLEIQQLSHAWHGLVDHGIVDRDLTSGGRGETFFLFFLKDLLLEEDLLLLEEEEE